MAGDFGSTGGINSRGMPDRVERVFSRRQRGGSGGTVGADYEQDIIPYTKKRFYQHYPGAIIVWLLFHTIVGGLIGINIDEFVKRWLEGDTTGLVIYFLLLAAPSVIANVVLVVRYRMFKRFERVALTDEEKGTEMLEVFE